MVYIYFLQAKLNVLHIAFISIKAPSSHAHIKLMATRGRSGGERARNMLAVRSVQARAECRWPFMI
jgi:hypothetical protein